MSKETKPKSEGCRWKVLWTFLLGFLLFGASNASAATVTFIFNIPQSDYSKVEVNDGMFEPKGLYVGSNGKIIDDFTSSETYVFSFPKKVTIASDPEDNFEITDYGYLDGGLYYVEVDALNSGTVTFTDPNFTPPTVDPDPDPDPEPGPQPSPSDGIAKFSATYKPWNGSSYPISKDVHFTYADNKITIPGKEINSGYTDDLILPIDWNTMTVKTQYCWCYTYENVFPVYYADYYPATESSKRTGWLTGTVENVDGKTIITLSTWGELMWNQGAAHGYYGDGTWENTQIEFSLEAVDPEPVDPDPVDPDPDPEPGDYIKCVLTSVEYQNGTLKFSDDNILGVGTGLAPNGNSSYGGYFKLRWTPNISAYSTKKGGAYYYILPANIDPDTKKITLRPIDMNSPRDNHIKFDFSNGSYKVYEGLYNATSNEDPGSSIKNSCIVIASYYDNGMKDFNRIERAFYLKGGEFLGDTDGNMPSVTQFGSITFEANKQYQWELLLEEIPLEVAEEGDYASGKGNFKSLYTQTGGSKDELRTATVDGVYNNGKLRVDKLPTSIPHSRTYCQEITFSVDLENGTVTATDQVVNALLVGASYENLYFATYPGMNKTVTGSFVNIGDGKCQLTLDDWCEMYNSTTINGIYWAKTKIVFDFEVKGLKMGTEVEDPSVSYVPTVNYMYANVGSEAGEYKLYEPVKGEYNETAKTITLTGVAGKAENCPLTLNVDSEGKLVSKGNEVSSHEWDSEGISIVYSDVTKTNSKVYGQVENTMDGTCVITLDAWGDYVPDPDFEFIIPNQSWYNTYIVLDLSIPGLPNYKEDNGDDPDPGVQGGTVEGEWQFDVEDLYNHKTSTEKWTASLSDGMLHFSGNDNFADFYVEYYSDGTVLIPGQEMFVGVGGSRNYDLYQIGFSNYSLVDQSYDAKDVTGQFDASKGTMAFTTSPREGILWRAYLDGELAGGYDMLSFVKGTQISKSESEPGLLLNVEEITCNPTDFFADVIIPIHTTGLPMDTPISLTYSIDDKDAVTKEVNAGNNMISFMGLKPGTEYTLHLQAESGDLKGENVTYTFKTTGENPGGEDPGENPGGEDPGENPGGEDPGEDSGINSIDNDNSEVHYFNLQGIEIFNPTPGTICIKVNGKKVERIIVR